MTEDLDVYQGRARRRCPKCGLEVEIEKPTRVLSKTSNPARRKRARQELARQLLWEAMCEDCRAFWNLVVRAIETGVPRAPEPKPETGIGLSNVPAAWMSPFSPQGIAARARERAVAEMAGE